MPILDYIWYELGDFFGTGSQRSAIFKDFTEGEMLAYKVNGVTNLDSIYQFLGNKDKQRTKTVYESFKSTIESGNIEAIKKLDWGPGAPGWPSEMKYAFRPIDPSDFFVQEQSKGKSFQKIKLTDQ
jgi:hypothetical protein